MKGHTYHAFFLLMIEDNGCQLKGNETILKNIETKA